MILVGIQFSCQDEEVVAEAVDIGNDVCIDFCAFFGKGKDASFCSSADGAADVCDGCGSASSWQDEAAEAGQDGMIITLRYPEGQEKAGIETAVKEDW